MNYFNIKATWCLKGNILFPKLPEIKDTLKISLQNDLDHFFQIYTQILTIKFTSRSSFEGLTFNRVDVSLSKLYKEPFIYDDLYKFV